MPFPRPEMETIELSHPVVTSTVVLEIATTGNDSAERDFTPISEVAFEGY